MIVLIGCVESKGSRKTEARRLYTSPLFRLSYQCASVRGARVWILSAKHGLIRDTDVIGPYHETLNDKRTGELESWARAVASSVDSLPADEVVILAGSRYTSFTRFSNRKIHDPMKGLSLGRRLQWLQTHMVP